MQLTIDSNEPLQRVLDVVGSLFGVRLVVSSEAPEAAGRGRLTLASQGSPEGTSSPVPRQRGCRSVPPRPAHRVHHQPARLRDVAPVGAGQRYPVKDRGRIPASVLAAYHQRDRVAE